MIPPDLHLETSLILMRPLMPNDVDPFFELAQDPGMWDYFSLNLADEFQLKKWMQLAIDERAAGKRIPFTIVEKETNRIAGSMSIGNISEYDHRAEIGWSWLGKKFRSTGINKHAKFALLRYLFETFAAARVEFKTDVQNIRARQGLRNIGGIEEGILRSHMKMWNNRRRTSIYYSILEEEWPVLKTSLFKDII